MVGCVLLLKLFLWQGGEKYEIQKVGKGELSVLDIKIRDP